MKFQAGSAMPQQRKEQRFIGTRLLIQDVLGRFMYLGKLSAPRRSILFIIRIFISVFKTAKRLPDLSIPETTNLILIV
jgi:hypothetical protein